MFHYIKYYLTPILSPIVLIGILLGGHWMWLGTIILMSIVLGGDAVSGEDPKLREYKHIWLIELPLHLALPMVTITLIIFAWCTGSGNNDFLKIGELLGYLFTYDFISARNLSMWSDYLGAVLGCGFLVAGYGTNVAHELTHRVRDKIAMFEGRWLLSASCNADFSIEHVYGHHVNVGTAEDPATANRKENVYTFFFRSSIMGHLHAWKVELARLRRKNHFIVSLQNQMITGYLMSIVWMAMFYIAGGVFGLAMFLCQALFAKFILEVVNYMEHYGLQRDPQDPVGPQHSWNTNKIMSSIVLYTLTRHSAHHEKSVVPFWNLDPYPNAPQMPYGYLTTLLICLIPPLWYKVMEAKLEKWDIDYAN